MSLGLHSIARLRFQASIPEWAFRRDAAESAQRELLQRHLFHHLDRRPGRRPPVQQRQRELPVAQVRWLHFEAQARHLHVDPDLHLLRVPQVRQVRLAWPALRPGQIQ
jgi:hypothetical protein